MDGKRPPLDDAMPTQPGAEPDRSAQPVDAEQPPRLPFPVVGVGASAGGIEAFGEFLDAMPPDGGMAFVFILHLPPDAESHLAGILGRRTAMPVRQVEDGMIVEADHVYVIRPGHVLTLGDGRLRLGPELGGPRAANRPVDDFFRSLAGEQRERAVCIILSGMGSNGTAGAQAVKAVGGLCIAQDPEGARYPSMPQHLVDAGYADHILAPAEIPAVLLAYAGSPYASGGREADAGPVLDREGHHLREVLAVIRTRVKQDFTGYRKATLLRRVQRRMGLTRTGSLAEYARLLRQSPAEVAGLADDLLIHVTGFFRDPGAWEALRRQVIVPLVAGREPGSAVRAWVAACSSGEEAYSLAMLLVEESDRAGKPLDIKVFATDLADRTLARARAGVYPGGIESELSPERLERFFAREAEMYRVRPDLRERVVFAPQNILQDPPFSRLDIATCRNLLIYLEPDTQMRVLHLLHFGLREGGALFLGSSETVGAADGPFRVVDKRARIFLRVGPTRPGAVDFHRPRLRPSAPETRPTRPVAPVRAADGPPATLVELSRQALLAAHTPPAVTVDRDGQVAYYHGDVGPFLTMVGEPTRALLLLAREGLRGAIRAALRRAAAESGPATVTDGWADLEPGRRHRVAVSASPVVDPDARAGPPAHFVVSFDDRGELAAPVAAEPSGGAEGWHAEVRRLRSELQGTFEEMQASNEELKASNEEVTSVNEELQSANEELETSKEEMQSLNEELTTVNSQLRLKAEEYQAASSDLASLLASTDIAVLFLDTGFRIRRFTPAARDLIDLIPGDVGRPVSALARKFDDPDLDADCRVVLERLVPLAREVAGADGRHYLRRVLPYRTTDNRIDGVVVTFVDITDRKAAEGALAAEKEYAESIVQTLHEPLLVLHPDLTVRGVNPAFYAHFRVNPADTIGRKVYRLGNGQWDIPALRTLLEEVLPDSNVFSDYEVTHEFEGLGRRVMLVNGRRLDHVQLILLGIRDITERKRAEDAVRASEEKYRGLFDSMDEGYLLAEVLLGQGGEPADLLYLEANPAAVRLAGRDFVGRRMREIDPGYEDYWLDIYGRVVGTGEPVRAERYAAPHGRYFEFYAFRVGDPDGRRVATLFQDVTERKRREERQAYLLRLADALRPLADPVAVQAEACRVLGEHLGADRAYYVEIDEVRGECRVRRDYLRGDSPSMAAVYRLADYGWSLPIMRAGQAIVFADVDRSDLVPEADRPALARIQIVAHVAVPVVKAGVLVGCACLTEPAPREWTEAEVDLVRETGERTWAAVERAKAEADLHESEQRLQLALEATALGVFEWDLATDRVIGNARFDELFGVTGDGPALGADILKRGIHPGDLAAVEERLGRAMDPDSDGRYEFEFRLAGPDAVGERWVLTHGQVYFAGVDGGRRPVRVLGSGLEVTARKRAEAALRESEGRQAFLLHLGDSLRAEPDAQSVAGRAVGILAEHLGLDLCWISEVFEDRGYSTVGPERIRPGLPPMTGEFRLSDYPEMMRQLMTRPMVIRDAAEDPAFSAAEKALLAHLNLRSLLVVALRKGPGRVAWALAAAMATPRKWTDGERLLLEDAAERTRAAVERARAEAALRAELGRTALLRDLAARLVTEESGPAIYDEVLSAAIAITGADAGTVQTFDAATNSLVLLVTRGIDLGLAARFRRIDVASSTACGIALRTGERTFVDFDDDGADDDCRIHVEAGLRSAQATPLRSRDGHPIGMLNTHWRASGHRPGEDQLRFLDLLARQAADLIERRRSEDALRASEERLRAVAANLPGGAAFLVGPDLRYTLAEGHGLRDAGFAPADFEGKTLAEALPPDLAAEYEPRYRAALAGEPFRVEHAAHGRQYVTHGQPLRDADGRVTAALAVSYDITGLRLAEDRLRLALSAARMGIWTLDVGTGEQVRDANLNVLLGLPAAETSQPFNEFLGHVHPDDRAAVRGAFAASVAGRQPLNVEFRVVRPDGGIRWLRDQGDVFGDAAAGAHHMAGACVDVTDRKEAELALRESEERRRLILESATDFAILTQAADRTVTSWSPGAEAIFGYAAGEVVGRPGDVLFTPEDRAAGVPEREAEEATRQGRAADERWHLRKDGTRFYASGAMRPLRDGGGFVKVARDLTDRKRMEDELRDARDRLEERVRERTAELDAEMARRVDLTRRLASAQEDERRRVSRDLHDTIGQLMAGLSLAFKAVEDSGRLPAPAAARLAEAQQVANELGREVHGLAVRLRPTALDDIGLDAALGQLVAEWSGRTGVPADFQAAGIGASRLPAEVETVIYRIVQEALTNVGKHARASRVSVAVSRPDGFVVAMIEDDGVGFAPEATPQGRLGIIGMRERAALVGGELDFESGPGAGTTVVARIPVAEGGGS